MLPLPEKRSYLCQSRDGSPFFKELLIFFIDIEIRFQLGWICSKWGLSVKTR